MLLVAPPWLAGQKRNQSRTHLFPRTLNIPLVARRQHRTEVGRKLRHADSSFEIALEQGATMRALLACHVSEERLDDSCRIDSGTLQCGRQVEQVTALASLVERSQFRRQQFIEFMSDDWGPNPRTSVTTQQTAPMRRQAPFEPLSAGTSDNAHSLRIDRL